MKWWKESSNFIFEGVGPGVYGRNDVEHGGVFTSILVVRKKEEEPAIKVMKQIENTPGLEYHSAAEQLDVEFFPSFTCQK